MKSRTAVTRMKKAERAAYTRPTRQATTKEILERAARYDYPVHRHISGSRIW